MPDEIDLPQISELVLAVGPTARQVLSELGGALSRAARRPILRGLTAEYPPVRIAASEPFKVHDLAAVPDTRDAFAWCRAESAGSETGCRWHDPLAGQNLEPAHVTWLYRYSATHGGCDRLWDDLVASKPATIHVVCSLTDGASCLLPESLERLAERLSDVGGKGWTHVHVVLPETPRGYSLLGHRVADDAAEVLRQIVALSARPSSIHTAWWILGGPSLPPLRPLAEACSLVARLLDGTLPDPLSAWCGEYADLIDQQRTGISIFGSYRCTGGPSLPPDEDAVCWPEGFPETRVPADRRDLLARRAIVWNGPGEWLSDLKARDPRWDAVRPCRSSLPGWTTCRAWLAIDPQDLWWWHPDADRFTAEGRTSETVVSWSPPSD